MAQWWKSDSTMVKPWWHNGEIGIVRWKHNCTITIWQLCYRVFIIVSSCSHLCSILHLGFKKIRKSQLSNRNTVEYWYTLYNYLKIIDKFLKQWYINRSITSLFSWPTKTNEKMVYISFEYSNIHSECINGVFTTIRQLCSFWTKTHEKNHIQNLEKGKWFNGNQ